MIRLWPPANWSNLPAVQLILKRSMASLSQPSSEQAIVCVVPRPAGLLAVELEGLLGLIRHVRQLGHGHLHAIGQFVLRDARVDDRIAARDPGEEAVVEARDGGARTSAKPATRSGVDVAVAGPASMPMR